MRITKALFLIVSILFVVSTIYGQNRLNSRLFYQKPPLHFSKSKVSAIDLSAYDISVEMPIDNRSKFYGEIVYKNNRTQPLDEFYKRSTAEEIQRKIIADIASFEMKSHSVENKQQLVINTTVEVFYPDVRGFIFVKSFAKVRLLITAVSEDKELINKRYESFYITSGNDSEFEGSAMMTIEQGANVTIGVALRKALDEFYTELKEKL